MFFHTEPTRAQKNAMFEREARREMARAESELAAFADDCDPTHLDRAREATANASEFTTAFEATR